MGGWAWTLGWTMTLVLVSVTACAPRVDESPILVLPLDGGSMPADGGVDASDRSVDGSPPFDPDAGPPADGDDAGDACGPCVSPTACSVPRCRGDVCELLSVEDGTSCDEVEGAGICVEGACVARGCGDGYREPGPDPAREECDDRSPGADDACADDCTARIVLVARPSSAVAMSRASIAADETGALLVVWSEARASGSVAIARRYSRHGAPLDPAPVVLEHLGPVAAPPVVTGLRRGWVLGLETLERNGGVASFVLVDAFGAISARRSIASSTSRQHALRVSSHGDRWAAVWLEDGAKPSLSTVVTRQLELDSPVTDAVAVSTASAVTEPTVYVDAERVGVAWARASSSGPAVLAQTLDGDGVPMGEPTELAQGTEPCLLSAGPPWSVAWTRLADDPRGDVWARIDGGPPTVLVEGPTSERYPVAARVSTGFSFALQVGTALSGRPRDVLLLATDDSAAIDELSPEGRRLAEALVSALGVQSSPSITRAGASTVWLSWLDTGASSDGTPAIRMAASRRL